MIYDCSGEMMDAPTSCKRMVCTTLLVVRSLNEPSSTFTITPTVLLLHSRRGGQVGRCRQQQTEFALLEVHHIKELVLAQRVFARTHFCALCNVLQPHSEFALTHV
jgi:hypothetical protein